MARSVTEFVDMMVALLPPGDAWRIEENPDLQATLVAAAQEFARIDARIDAMFSESLPSETSAWLPEWEADYGLPDSAACAIQPVTIAQRREVLTARVVGIGGDDRQRLLDTAAAMGFPDITITEYKPGDVIPGWEHLDPQDSAFFIRIGNLPVQNLVWFSAGQSHAGDPVRSWDTAALLECELGRVIHSHKTLIFSYTE